LNGCRYVLFATLAGNNEIMEATGGSVEDDMAKKQNSEEKENMQSGKVV
jgi:hypothetical protein